MQKNKAVLKVIKEFPYQKIGSWGRGNPFTIAFVYPQLGEPCIVKGGMEDVRPFIDKNYPVAIVNYQFLRNGKIRGGYYRINGEKKKIHIYLKKSTPSYRKLDLNGWIQPAKIGHRCQVIVYDTLVSNEPVFQKELRRLPRCWMKELNPYVGKGLTFT